jgi:dihydrofolate synthase/folylpolyglutamate synthase
MTNEEIITYIYKKRTENYNNINNSRMVELMNNLGNPQDNLKFIHIAGTNGKGSTIYSW